jgi:hypothetical protein
LQGGADCAFMSFDEKTRNVCLASKQPFMRHAASDDLGSLPTLAALAQ